MITIIITKKMKIKSCSQKEKKFIADNQKPAWGTKKCNFKGVIYQIV